jgi:hypothetical protein
MYRETALRDGAEAPPAELLYPIVEQRRDSSAVALFKLVSFPAFIGIALSLVVTPTVGGIGMFASASYFLWQLIRKPRPLVLTVEGGELRVMPRGSQHVMARFALEDLIDVVLDTKTIHPVGEGSSAIPAMRFIDARVSPPVDTARIVLVGPDGTEAVPLTETYLAHMEATEWFGKIRSFLRKHGWAPESERVES